MPESLRNLRNLGQELYELGPKGAAFRVVWEISRHGGTAGAGDLPPDVLAPHKTSSDLWMSHLPFPDPIAVAEAVSDRIAPSALQHLLLTADRALPGEIECFGRWPANFGEPIEWHQNPLNGAQWPSTVPWRRALSAPAHGEVGDVKLCWEVARFPHAYHMARCAAFFPETAPRFARALTRQIRDFAASNPYGYGIQWASGQETAFRLLAWLFCADTLLTRTEANVSLLLRNALLVGAAHIEKYLDYARLAVYNNHLLSEALALFAVGALLPDVQLARGWRDLGRTILDEESRQQFYPDGAYIQQSHNYHRIALYDLLWACLFARSMGDRPSSPWLEAIDRSVAFLVAHQNPGDGRLPNYGNNDGGMPGIFSTCDYSDFRPVLQTANVLVHGKRLYEPGPWDEMVAWFLGPAALDTPLERPRRRSVAFAHTGYQVLRGRDERSFATFRCGTLLDRFSQIDMLHVDVWWRGKNVLVDAGSYLYNDRPEWHQHFMRTACHNTVTIDGRDQMLHFRQFKVLYRTHARLLQFDESAGWMACTGEHYGYQRYRGGCVHTRSLLFLKDDLWVVVDHVTGSGSHAIRLHWLGGDFPYVFDAIDNRLALETEAGGFFVQVLDAQGQPIPGNVVAGQERPPRGWLSRYYGEKVAVPSLAVAAEQDLPMTFVSVLSGGRTPEITVDGAEWSIVMNDRRLNFLLVDGRVTLPRTDPASA
jgi:asparagine synthase (glutamine-hydrolysing)